MTKTSYLEFRKIYCLTTALRGGLADLLLSACGASIAAEINKDPNAILKHLKLLAEANGIKWNWPGELPIRFWTPGTAGMISDMILAPDFLYLPWPPPLDHSHETEIREDGPIEDDGDIRDQITAKKALITGLISTIAPLPSRQTESIPFLAALGPFLGDDEYDGTHGAFRAIHERTLHKMPELLAFVKNPQSQARTLADKLPSNIKIEIAEVVEDIALSYDSGEGRWVIWLPRWTSVPGHPTQSVDIKWYFQGSTYSYDEPGILEEEKSIVGISSMLQCTAKCSNFWDTTANK